VKPNLKPPLSVVCFRGANGLERIGRLNAPIEGAARRFSFKAAIEQQIPIRVVAAIISKEADPILLSF
jgi:hypothetical protein